MGITELVQSKGYKRFMAYIYGWGASLVIIGALFKINHYPGASLMLIIGMSTEAIIFFFSAFEPPHEEVDWRKVYPQLREGAEETPDGVLMGGAGGGAAVSGGSMSNNLVLEKVDEMFQAAGITPKTFTDLKQGFEKLAEATQSINSIVSVVDINTKYALEMAKVIEQLTTLYGTYQSQIESTNKQIADVKQMQENMGEIMSNFSASLDDSRQYRSDISELSQKVSALNNMYGKMLSALSTVNNK